MILRLCNNFAVENRSRLAYNEKGHCVDSRGFSAKPGKAYMKRLCSLLLAVLLALTALCCQAFPLDAVAASYLSVGRRTCSQNMQHAHTDLSFDALSCDVPDLSLEIARTKELLFRIDNGECKGIDAQRTLEQRIEAFYRARSAASIAYVRHCTDVANDQNREVYEHLSAQLDAFGCLLLEAQRQLCVDPALKDRYDEETVRAIEREAALHRPAMQALMTRERELIGAYDALATLSVRYDGTDWTRERILTDPTLSYASFCELYALYRHTYNERAGKLFLELIETRNAIARAGGFDSYVEYGYESYGRDYTPQDAERLAETVRRELVPLFVSLQPAFYEATMRLNCGTYEKKQTVEAVGRTVADLLPEFAEPWTYMIEHGLLNMDTSPTRMPGSFTTYFETYGAPFLFLSWDGSYEMPTTLLHEFGHYAGYYLNGVQRMRSADPLDLAEIDAQGLELLELTQYNNLYGALSDAARVASLVLALYAIITGCMEDAFQQFAYRTEHVTLEQLNAAYASLASAYGLKDMGLSGESWVEISHTFRAPMYYISYATSMLGALQLYALSDTDRAAAVSAYRKILMRPIGAAFRTTLQDANLRDPFDPSTCAALKSIFSALCA